MRVRLPHLFCLMLSFIILSASSALSQEIAVSGARVSDPTNTGAASAAIPIEVPPGRGGIAPALAIDYNSNRSNGWLGVGWELELGEIQRSTKFGLNYSVNDYIYLSGGASSELVQRGDWGPNYYGSKIEGAFSKLYYNPVTGGWEVTNKGGTKFYFGSTEASRQENQYGTFRWCLDRVEDRNGNYMTVSYFKDQGEIYLDRIDYTGNINGLSPTNYVQFIREARTDVPPMYATNTLVKTSYRLAAIEVYAKKPDTEEWQLARKYVLNYAYSGSTSRSLLTSVTHYGNDGTSTLPVTTFGWQTGGTGWAALGGIGGALSPGQGYIDYYTYPVVEGDWNRDGRMDIGRVHGSGIRFYLSNGSGGWTQITDINDLSPAQGYSNASTYPMVVGDFNGDGRTDIGRVIGNGVRIFISNGSGGWTQWPDLSGQFSPAQGYSDSNVYPLVLGDFNGDGKTDIGRVHSSGVRIFISNGAGGWTQLTDLAAFGSSSYTNANTYPMVLGDFNGDGKMDIGRVHSSGIRIYLSNIKQDLSGGWTQLPDLAAFGSSAYTDATTYPMVLGDFNGDGKMDIGRVTGSGVRVYLTDGQGGWTQIADLSGQFSPAQGYTNDSIYPMVIGDFNGDGKTDVGRVHGSGVRIFTTDGAGGWAQWADLADFSPAQSYPDSNRHPLLPGDFNGDGRTDMARIGSSGVGFYLAAGAHPDLLSTVGNGIGGTTSISYTSSSAYANDQLPFIVQTVSSVSANDGNGNVSTTNYTYAGGQYDPVEREFKGFSYVKGTVNLTDVPGTTSVSTETWFSQTAPYSGMPLDQMVRDSGGKIYSRSINTYQSSSPYIGVSFPKLTKKEDYLCDGVTTNPALLDDCRKVVTEFEVDAYGNPTRKLFWGDLDVPGDGRDENTVYTTDLLNWMFLPDQTYVYDSTGVVRAMTWFSYDTRGNLVAKTDWLEGGTSPVSSFDYDIYGNQIAVTDPKGSTGTIEYDTTRTYPVKTTNPLGHTAYNTYDYRTGKPLTKTDPNGNVATLEYDPFGRPLEAVNPHDGASAAAWKESYYDGLGRVIKTKTAGPDGKAIVSETVYNYRGLVQKTSLPYFVDGSDQPLEAKRWSTFTYDALGRPIRIDSPDGTYGLKLYDQNRTTMVDANGHVKVEEKNVYGKLIKAEEYAGVYPNHTLYATTTYEYDILGNLLMVTDALGNETLMVYDSLSRKIAMQDPDMGLWSYQYDDNGNLTSQTDAKNQTVAFTYDALNRVTLKDYPTVSGMVDVVYEYDNPSVPNSKGKLTKVTDASGVEEYSYDSLGRAWKITKTVDSVAYVTETAFDALGRAASIKYPDNEVVTYTYDAAGNLTNVPGYVTFSSFNALGQAGTTTYANGVTTVQQYYADNNRLFSITTNSPAAGGLQNLTYEYDSGGNVQSINDLLDPNRTQTFTYDHLNRLTQAESFSYGGTLTYQYNEIGNMMYNSQVGSYFYSPTKPHAVIQAGTNIYEYDDNGNMITRGNKTIVYDYDNRATSIGGSGGTVNSVYDYTGLRIKKIAPSGTTIYIGKLYECKAGNCTKYVFAGGTRIASKSSGGTYYYHGDHLGSASLVTDALGNKVQEIYYYPFGQVRTKTGVLDVKHKYTGQEEDPETGLYYYNARYYDPVLARFISPDPIIQNPYDPQDLNRYSYVNNNPLRYTDPTGHFKLKSIFKGIKKIFKAVVSVVVGVVVTVATGGVGAGFWGAVIAGMAGGAAAGATSAVLNGGNILEGILMGAATGAITGGIFNQAGAIIRGIKDASLGVKAAIHAAAGAISGGINSAIRGGDIGRGMLTGAISAGIARLAGGTLFEEGHLLPEKLGYQLAGRAVIGGITGGIVSQMSGGDFGDGFVLGGITAAAGYLFNELGKDHALVQAAKDPNWASRSWNNQETPKGNALINVVLETLADKLIESAMTTTMALTVAKDTVRAALNQAKQWLYQKTTDLREYQISR